MGITIKPDDDRDDIRRKFGASVDRQEVRTSDARESRLRASSRRRTREWNLGLNVRPDLPTAHVNQEADDPVIEVTGREIPQPVTDLDGVEWDYAAQRAFGWHEDGHVLYTDHNDLMSRLDGLSSGQKGVAKSLWNALEDGAIELQLTEAWNNAYPVLRALRANLFEDRVNEGDGPGIEDIERGGQVFTVSQAIEATCLETWMREVYDLDFGIRARLMDPDDVEFHFSCDQDRRIYIAMLDPIDDVVADVLSEPVAEDRNARIFEFIRKVLDVLDDAEADGKAMANRRDGEGSGGMPDDADDSATGEAREDAEVLRVVGEEEIDDADDWEPADPEDLDDVEEVEIPDDVQADIADEVDVDRRETSGATSDLLDEIEALSEAAGDDDLASDEVEVADEAWTANERTFRKARDRSRSLAQILRNRLQQERVSETKLHQRRGRYTGRGGAAVRAARGESEVNEREVEPEDKDYRFMFVVDRSGSMSSDMSDAEVALGALALALEEVGAETCIIELYGNEARLAKPFGVETTQRKERVFHGNTAGSTPLSPAVQLSRARLLDEGENSYMVVVTDGRPNDSDAFSEAIDKTPLPTIGVNLGTSGAGVDKYDRVVAAEPGDDLADSLFGLAQEVMF